MKFLTRFSRKSLAKAAGRCWLHRVLFGSKSCAPHVALVLIAVCSTIISQQATASEIQTSQSDHQRVLSEQEQEQASASSSSIADDDGAASLASRGAAKSGNETPPNHRPLERESLGSGALDNDQAAKSVKATTTSNLGRRGRQYDGQISSPSAPTTSDGAYLSQVPMGANSNYGNASPSGGGSSSYLGDLAASYPQQNAYYDLMARAYPPMAPLNPSVHHSHPSAQASYPTGHPPGFAGPLSSMLSSMSAGSSAFPLLGGKNFDVSEIVCTAIAVAIGAVIIGAPFILIYLFVANQMNGGPGGLGANGNAINLTGPTSSTTVGGRKKRHNSFSEALVKQLSPMVNSEQVANTFKLLMKSIAKYQ